MFTKYGYCDNEIKDTCSFTRIRIRTKVNVCLCIVQTFRIEDSPDKAEDPEDKSHKIITESDRLWQTANMACIIHVDSLDKAFKFEANRFWPKGVVMERPTPDLLVKVLEEIPSKGTIREITLPLLWQVGYIFYYQNYVFLYICFNNNCNSYCNYHISAFMPSIMRGYVF